MPDLLALLMPYTSLRKVSTVHGGEYAGCCPFCGGHDRFRAWPASERPHWWCRRCERHGDDIAFLRERDGLSFSQACSRARGPLALTHHRPAPPALQPIAKHTPVVEPPVLDWQRNGQAFVQACQECLWSAGGSRALLYLKEQRCLSEETIRAWGLGYHGIDEWSEAADWGLPRQNEQRNLWLPRGIVIPCVLGGELWSIKVRRHAGDLGGKYVHVRGSVSALFGADTARLEGHPRSAVVLTEGEFDAMLLYQEASGLAGVATLGGASTRLSVRWLWVLRDARHILVAYDLDDAGGRGAASAISCSQRMSLARPIGAKDLTDMHRAGGDLSSWLKWHLRTIETADEKDTI